MKKLLCTITIAVTMLSGFTNNSTTENERKIEVVKRLYSEEAFCDSPEAEEESPTCKKYAKSDKFTGYKDTIDEKTTIEGNATPDLKRVLDADWECVKKYEEICMLGYDIVVQGQDYSTEKILSTVKFEVVPNGNVKVDFHNFEPVTLYYVMQCDEEKCLIDDILEADYKKVGEEWKKTNTFSSFKEKLKTAKNWPNS